MPQQRANNFTTWEFTPGYEETQAAILPQLNQFFIQNKIAEIAEDRLRIKYDPEHPLLFVQEEAELHGQILILQWLLDESNEAQKLYTELQANQPTN